MWLDAQLSDFTCPAAPPVIDLAVNHDSAPDTSAHSCKQEVPVWPPCAQPSFSQRVAVDVVVDRYRHIQSGTKPMPKRKADPPREVKRRIANRAGCYVDLTGTGYTGSRKSSQVRLLVCRLCQNSASKLDNASCYRVWSGSCLRVDLGARQQIAIRRPDGAGNFCAANVEHKGGSTV